MLRITRIPSQAAVCLRLEGRLVGEWIDLLADVCRRENGAPVVLDLAGVTFVGRPGVELLARLHRQGVDSVHAPGFLAGLIPRDD